MRRRLPHRGARLIPLEIPASGTLFEGHFPGRPILPGVGLLDLALRALPAGPGTAGLRAVDLLRLRSIVVPGERLALEATPPGPDGEVRLEVRRGSEVVASGTLKLGDPGGPSPVGGATAGAAGVPSAAAGVPHLDRLLPHRATMRLVAAVESEPDDGIVCAARVPAGSPFAANGTAPALVAIEMAAQAAAVFEALRRFRASGGESDSAIDAAGPRIGYLVGARGVRFLAARIPAGAACQVAIHLAGLAGPLSTYRFDVDRGGDPVAVGSVSTWITATAA